MLLTNQRRPILTLTGGYLGRRSRHADRRLRPLSLCLPRLSRAITTTAPTTCRRAGGARPHAAGNAEPAQPVHEHSMDGGRHAAFAAPPSRCRAAMSGCAPRWTWSSRSPPARRTSCRSTARGKDRRGAFHHRSEGGQEMATRQDIAEANRRRYEELRAAGQGATLKAPAGADRARRRADRRGRRHQPRAGAGGLVRDGRLKPRRGAAHRRRAGHRRASR